MSDPYGSSAPPVGADNPRSTDDKERYRTSSNDEEDHELKVAKEMAIAIQKNPNLTPVELKELMAKISSTSTGNHTPLRPSHKKSPLLKSISKSAKGVKSSVKSSVKKAFKPDRHVSTPNSNIRSGVKLGDQFEEEILSIADGDVDDRHRVKRVSANMQDNDKIRIMGIVWKRRSGLGKYSTTAAWERRRVVLRGTKLYYYRTNMDKKDDESVGDDDILVRSLNSEEAAGSKKSWKDSMTGSGTKGVKNDARGYLDLQKENANVTTSTGHSGAPTPFALSIKILTQTKWKLCFDTQGELMQWLAAMTDVIVQASVDEYNAAILSATDPSRGSDFSSSGQLSEPPMIANTTAKMGGHRLWVAGHYKVQSENYPAGGLEDISESELDDFGSGDDSDEDDNRTQVTAKPKKVDDKELVVSMEGGQEIWAISSQYIWQWGAIWNLVIFLSRASSTSVESFWYLITFANIALFGFMKKQTVGGKVKSVMSRKMMRRLSSGMEAPKSISDPPSSIGDDNHVNVPVPSMKPKAGTTSMRIENPTDLPVNKDGHVFAGWRWMDPSMMKVRSHNYKKDKKKVSSPGELYKCVHVDIFESRQRYPDMARRVELPEVGFKDDGPKTWNAPDSFVVSIAIPTDPPKLYNSSENGGGYTVTVYFTMHEDTREILKRVTADGYDPGQESPDDPNASKVNAARLLDEWCRRAPTDDDFCARFKVLPNAQNLKEIGLPGWISKYNGKPFLIKRPGQTGFLYRHPEKSCIEFDISLHPFPYLAKQGICFMKDAYFKKVLVTFGFLIEGRAEDELPECLIGLMQLCYPDPIHAIQGEDFMAGKSAKSF